MALHRNSIKFQAFKTVSLWSSTYFTTYFNADFNTSDGANQKNGDAGRTGANRPKTSRSAVHEAKRRRGQENRLPRALASIADLTSTKIRWDGDLGILTGPTGQSYKPWDDFDYLGTWASVCSQLWSRLPKNQSCQSSHKDLDTPSHSARFRHACQFCIACDIP